MAAAVIGFIGSATLSSVVRQNKQKSPAQGQQAAQMSMMRTMMMITEMALVAGGIVQTSTVQMKISRGTGSSISEPVARPWSAAYSRQWNHFRTPVVPAARSSHR